MRISSELKHRAEESGEVPADELPSYRLGTRDTSGRRSSLRREPGPGTILLLLASLGALLSIFLFKHLDDWVTPPAAPAPPAVAHATNTVGI